MGHVIAPSIGTASLDTFGGLVTNANAIDLPEGASPRTWDTDFIVGSVFTRAGLASVYRYTETLTITSFVVSYDVATFGYIGKQPVINEGFVLSGFTGATSFLNGLTVFVTSVDPSGFTFTADFDKTDDGPFVDLLGTAASTTGNFTGPNAGSHVEVVSDGGNVWSNPEGVLGNTVYAQTNTGSENNSTENPTVASDISSGFPWTNPQNVFASGASVATISLTASPLVSRISDSILAHGMSFAVPSDAQIVGVKTSFSGKSTGAAGTSSVRIQLAENGNPVGVVQSVPINSTMTTYTQGSSTFTWGDVLSTDLVNGAPFGILLSVKQDASAGTFSVNTLTVTVYYTTASSSEALQETVFTFSIPSSSGLSGFGIAFEAFSSAASTISFQLMKNGEPVGDIKQQVLSTVPTVYSLGSALDSWGTSWTFADVNNTSFGLQIVASGLGTTFVRDVDIISYLTPGLENFNYIKSYVQDNGQTDTLALDAAGIMWMEDVTNAEGTLVISLTGILPGSFAKSATANDQEYICFSDLNIGTDRPRVFNGSHYTPLSQVGPGAPPSFVSTVGSVGSALSVDNFVISGDVVTFDYTGTTPTPGQIYTITGATPAYLNFTGTVLSSPSVSPTQFSMALGHADVTSTPIDPPAAATLATSYPVQSITQFPSHSNPDAILWSSGPGSTSPGSVLTVYYSVVSVDGHLQNNFNAGIPVYVYITGDPFGFDGTYQVTGIGLANPPGLDHQRFFFTVNVGSVGFNRNISNPVTGFTYQMTYATLTTSTPIPNLSAGDTLSISDATPTGWNGSWPVVAPLKSGVLNITSTQMDATGTATYGYNVASGVGPTDGEIVTIQNATNNAVFNATGVVSNVTGATFQIEGFPAGAPIPFAVETQAVGTTFGTEFTFDPGAKFVGTNTNPIFGNDSGSGQVTIVGGSITPIGAGTRQAVVFFITDTGYETAPSPPITFTTSSQANFINATNIPIGPPNVIARGIAFTEAGQNGVPGANFYVIPNDVTIVVGNVTTTYKSTIIRDNVTTTANFTFTDAVLLNSTEIDVQGNDLFNLIELGSSAWCVPYASRMFYGLQLNKVDNFNNLTFDGGYLPNPGGQLFPLGWTSSDGGATVDLQISPVTGMALLIFNSSGSTQDNVGLMSQPAYQDPYRVPIINPNVTYSIRLAASAPAGINVGILKFQLVDFNPSIGYGTVYGEFDVDLADMSSNVQTFAGTLLTTPFTTTVSPQLAFALKVDGMGAGANVLIDRIEVFPTELPNILAQVYGSYVDNLEAVDASGSGGILDTSAENSQACMGGFVMHDNLYLLKTDSMVSTEDNPNSEPGGWGVHEVSNRVGTVGINSYDTGEEWLVTACRSGIYGFNGGQPTKLMQEIWNVWNAINWDAGRTIVLRNDIINKRLLCAVPLPTPNIWLPFDPPNPAPASPNVILMCNYEGLSTFEELVNSPEMHTTMFGTLAAVDMKRKWSIWRIKTPYMDFIVRSDGISKPLFVCNGIQSSKIYQFLDDQLSDDGVAINGLYTTYGFVNAAKAATLPIFGFHAKRYTVLQVTTNGAGTEQVRVLQNTLAARYPYTVPGGIKLAEEEQDDFFRPLNVRGNRVFLEFSTNAVGEWFNLSKILLSGKADPHNLNPTGGGNLGYAV